ncbi:MAG: hypothetical protein EOM68_07460 [Spirochaetia bacterium]|nr:hypothetical protein [Spirochaetia bacterium]
MEENRRVKLYNNLINSGKVTESEIGTPEQFATALASKDKAIKFYGKVKDIFTPQEIGTEVDFLSFLEPDYIGQPTAPRQGAAAPFTGAVVGAQAAPQQPSGSQPTPQQQPPQAELAQAEVPQASPISNTMAMIDDFGREFVPSTPETPVPVNQAINTAEKALQQEFGSIIPEYDRIKSKMSSQESGVTAGSSPLAMAAIPLKSKLNKQERAFLSENKDAIQQIEDQRKAIFSAKQFEKISKNLDIYDYKRKHGANWAKRLMSATFNTGLLEDRLTMGVTEMVRNIDAGAVMLKASVGDKLSKAEEALLDSYTGYKGKSEQKRDFVFSAGQSLQVLPEFLLNIMGGNVAMGGLRAGLRASLGVMSKEALKGLGKRAVAKNIGRKLAESAIFNVIAIPTRTTFYKELSEQTIDPNRPLGGAVYESAMRTFWEYYAEEFSEAFTGLGVGKYMGNKLFGKAIDDYAIRVGRIADKSWAKNITKAREMIQLGGVPIEMGEEIGTQLGNAVTLWSREDIEQLADPDFYKSVALSTVLMQGSFMGVAQGAKGVSGGVDRYRSSARLDKSIADVLAVENTSGGFIPQGVGRLTFMARNRRMKIADIEGWVKLANEATAQVEESDLSPERKESIKSGISKVIVAKAQKDGMATGLMSYMETESGVPFFNRKLDGKVVMGEAKDGKRYFILDQQQEQGKPGGNIYVVRDMEGETQEAFSGEFVNITTMEVEEFAQGWFEDHSNTVMAEQAMEGAEEISQEVEQKTSEPLTIDTVQPEMNVILAGQQMKVRRVSPIEIILEDSEGTIHHLDSEEAYTLTRVPEEVQAEVEQEVQGLMQGEEQPGQVMDVDPQEQPIGQEQPVEQVPLTEDGQPDYDRMAPDMLVRELSNDGFAEQEILDIVASTVETLGKEKATLEKKGAKTITEAAQKKKRIKEIDARIAELSAAMGLNTQPAINPQAEVQPQEQAQPTLQEQPQQASKTTRAQKDGVNNERMPTFREEVKALGDPMDAEEMVAFAIINNAKIRLSDKKDSKGFAKHMGISDSVEEKRKYIGIVRKDGMTPERFAEMLIETDEMNLLVGMGSIDVTDIVIDVVRNAYSKRSALNFIKAKREVGGDRALEQAYSGEITEWNLLQDIDDYYQEYYLSLTGEEHAQIQQLFIESAQQEQAFDDLMDMEDLPEDDIQDYGNRQSNRDAAENDQAGILGSVQQSDTGSNQEQGGDTAGVQASPEGQSGDVATGGQDTDLVQPQQDVAEKSPAMQALEQQRAEAVKERDRILKLASDRVGLFGDTKQDANDIFGGEGYDPAALQSLVDNQKALMSVLPCLKQPFRNYQT